MRRRATAFGGALVAAAAMAALTVIAVLVPGEGGTRRLPGLSAPVTIRFDRHGIPWIRARTDLDAGEALGFVHARDRWAQMDLMRRVAGGTLAALIGPAGLRSDRWVRTIGTTRAADASWNGLPTHTRAMLEAYARGVNGWLASRGRFAAPETMLFGPPLAWDPRDSLLWAEMMGLTLSSNLSLELARTALEGRLDPRAILALWPDDPAGPRREAARATPGLEQLAANTRAAIPAFPAPFTRPSQASNAWAIAGSRTTGGAPLLAGDPHLEYGLPALWYLARIDTDEGTLAGATAPGVPFVVLGRNRAIAWSFTTANADTEDVFVEHAIDARHYLGPDGPLPFTTRTDRIAVRGASPVPLVVRATRHGPVISDLDPTDRSPGGAVLSAAIASLWPGNTAAAGLDALNRAASVTEAGAAAAEITAPVQNLVVADRVHIALFTTGRVPIRRSGDGRLPADGRTGEHDWIGFRVGVALPRIVDPDDGLIVNANEAVPNGHAPLSFDAIGAWRARRIREVLEAGRGPIDLEHCSALQLDTRSDELVALLPRLRAVRPLDRRSRRALALLTGWDGSEDRDRPQALIADAWLARFAASLAAARGDPDETATAPLDFVADAILHDRSAGTARRLSGSLSLAVGALAAAWGDDPTRWRWGAAHRAEFSNPVWRSLPLLGWWRRIAVPVGGDASTVDAQAFVGTDRTRFTAVHGAAFRASYDLGRLDRSRYVIATGESGNPFGSHLLDLLPLWREGGAVALGAAPMEVQATLRLLPGREPAGE